MHTFTEDDLRRVMRVAVGVDDSVDLDGDITDTEFTDLGYDSLAMMEIMSRVEKEYGISVPDEAIAELPTPGRLVAYVGNRIAEVRA